MRSEDDLFLGVDRVHVRAEPSRHIDFRSVGQGAVDVWLWRLLWPTPETEAIGNRMDLKLHIGQSVALTPDLWVPHAQEYALPAEPTLRLSPDEGRLMMDALWRAGIRPSEMPETAGALKAMEAHISDLRASGIASRELASKILDKVK